MHQSLRDSPWHDCEQGTSWTRCPGSPVLTLGRVALALLVAVPAIVALAVVLGVVFVRVGGSPRRASVPVASGTVPADWQAYRSRLSVSS